MQHIYGVMDIFIHVLMEFHPFFSSETIIIKRSRFGKVMAKNKVASIMKNRFGLHRERTVPLST